MWLQKKKKKEIIRNWEAISFIINNNLFFYRDKSWWAEKKWKKQTLLQKMVAFIPLQEFLSHPPSFQFYHIGVMRQEVKSQW